MMGFSKTIGFTLSAIALFLGLCGCASTADYMQQIKEAQERQDKMTTNLVGLSCLMNDKPEKKEIKKTMETYLGFRTIDPLEYDQTIIDFTENLVQGATTLDEEIEKIFAFFQDFEEYEGFLTGKEVIYDYLKRKEKDHKAKPREDCWSGTCAVITCIRIRGGEAYYSEPMKDLDERLLSEAIENSEIEGRHMFVVAKYHEKYVPFDVTMIFGVENCSESMVGNDFELFAETCVQAIHKRKITDALIVEKLLKQAIALNPTKGYYYYVYGINFLNQPITIKMVEKAYDLSPGDFRCSYGVALAYARWARYVLDEKDGAVYTKPATKDETFKNYYDAQSFAEKSLRLFPDYAKAKKLLAEIKQRITKLESDN